MAGAKSPAKGANDVSGAFGAVSRAGAGADASALATFETQFEALQPLPASLVGQNDGGRVYGGAASHVTGTPRFAAPTAPLVVPQYGVVSDPVAGNSTRKLRGSATPAFGPNAFFGRWARYDLWARNNPDGTGIERFILRPVGERDVRVQHDVFVNSRHSTWTSEPACVTLGSTTALLYWGGLPLPGPIPPQFASEIYFGCPYPITTACDGTARFLDRAPSGFIVGNMVPLPVGAWFRLIQETTAGGLWRVRIDFLDGQGEFLIVEEPLRYWSNGLVDRMAFGGGFEFEGDVCYIDNLRMEGVRFCANCPGDATRDCIADFSDLNLVLGNFGQAVAPNTMGDLNNDGVVDFTDLNLVLGAFGEAC